MKANISFYTLIMAFGLMLFACETDDVEPEAPAPPGTPASFNFIVNEVLYDPPDGLAGDANGDGTRDPQEDEFIEFVNDSPQEIDVSGYKIYDAEALTINVPRFVIPDSTIIGAGKALVVFGGGNPTGNFGGATVLTSTDVLNLNNAGDFMTLTNAADSVIATFDVEPLSNNPNESYTRDPDITGGFVQHNAGTSSGVLFSPGTKLDGTPF